MPAPLMDAEYLERIETVSGCWILRSHRVSRDGYIQLNRRGSTKRAHRLIYELLVGPVPEGMGLDHLCRNRACVNPEHLEPVTSRINTLRSPIAKAALNARKTHCGKGHEFSLDNTGWQTLPGRQPRRICMTCQRAAYRKYNLKRVRP